MARDGSQKQPKRTIALDGDKLGHIVGALVALTVLLLCFYYQKVDGFTAIVRTGWAFVMGYAATFFLVRIILRTTLFEFIRLKQEEKGPKKGAHLGSGEAQAEAAEVAPEETPSETSGGEGRE